MRRILARLRAVGIAATVMIAIPSPSRADNGQVAAGIIGGLAVETLFGAAVAQPRYLCPCTGLRRSADYLLLDPRTTCLG